MAKSKTQKSLVIVESPAKAKTINRYLGADFLVKASMGHVRDLPSKGINVDIENNFEPTYEVSPGKKRVVSSLKSEAKKADTLYLATDLDREGEAIAWHLAELLGFKPENTYRVVFNAITKNAIQKAFANPGKIDTDKVLAQQARRILDRIVGYQISPLLWKKVTRGLSAGRVQSVAVRVIVEREREIRAFQPQEYWLVPAVFSTALDKDYSKDWQSFVSKLDANGKGPTLLKQNKWLADHQAFKADLIKINGEKLDNLQEKEAKKAFEDLSKADFKISDISVRRVNSKPSPPFITSTLQQAGANRLGFTAKRTMAVAQQLYEGLDLGSMGTLGLITYMRTDSTSLSKEALDSCRHYIEQNIGKDYLPEKPNLYASKKGAQEAHEAIRPTDPDLTPDDIGQFLSDEQAKLYDLIWRRFIASQMTPSQSDVTTIEIQSQTKTTYTYKTTGRVIVFDGFSRIWNTNSSDPQLPEMKTNDSLRALDIQTQQNFTKPPARYSEASLVKTLEKEGIGRPSTYASIISTIQDRKYVEKIDRSFHATDIGEVVTDKLCEFFPHVMDIAFTRHMEEQLDKIEDQHLEWISVLNEFYGPFKESLDKATEEMKHAKAETTPSDYTCPDCKKPMVYRFGKNGKFLSCSDYPECKFAAPCDKEGKMLQEETSEHKCPNCKKPMIKKFGRFGPFLGCSDYPECKTILGLDKNGDVLPPKPPPEPTGLKCYKCKDGELVIRQSKRGPFMGCNKFPKCRTIISIKQKDHLQELQDQGKWPPETWEEADEMLGRTKSKTKTTKSKKKTTKSKKKKTKKTASKK